MVSTKNIEVTYKGPVGPLRHRCSQCSASGLKLFRCSGCHAVSYCSREHQVAHRPQHKSICTKIRKARVKLTEEDLGVRNATPNFMTPANAFETHAGLFWGLACTRDYMRARFALAGEHLVSLGTLGGIQEALEHLQDMLRLCRGDNMGLRNIVPAMMLRLDLDQECYDFVKWWATCDEDGDRDWGDMTLPHLNIRGDDVFEDPEFLCDDFPDLNHVIAVLLLKMKLLVDIRNIKITRKILTRRRIPLELWELIELSVVRSSLSAKLQRETDTSLLRTESMLRKQICQLGATLFDANEIFMFYLFDPDEALTSRPEAYSQGSWEEMALAMQYSYAAWWETEGVLDLLKYARACAARDSEDEVDDMTKTEACWTANGVVGRRESESNLGLPGLPIENASYLGPWSERPSERHTQENKEYRQRSIEENAEDSLDEEVWIDDE